MSQLIRQANFNTVWTHFILNAGLPSFKIVQESHEDPYLSLACMYNGPDNTTCAFGLLLSEAERKEITVIAREGANADTIINKLSLSRFLRGKVPDTIYGNLQRAHDDAVRNVLGDYVVGCTTLDKLQTASFRAHLESRLRIIAQKYVLRIPEA